MPITPPSDDDNLCTGSEGYRHLKSFPQPQVWRRFARRFRGGHSNLKAVRVLGWTAEQRDLTQEEIRNRLAKDGHVFVLSTIWRLLFSTKLTAGDILH